MWQSAAAGMRGTVRTHMKVASSGWGPSGRRFKSCLPDIRKPASEASYRLETSPAEGAALSGAEALGESSLRCEVRV
jgi:hypothetical protein